MTTLRPFLIVLFATVAAAAIAIIGINFWVDPLRYYHDSDIIDYLKNARFQNAGLARNKSYQTVVMGTSMAQNFDLDQVDQVFDTQSVSITIPAGTAREQFLTLSLALRSQPVKQVIWGIHPKAFILPADELRQGANFPTYLYDNDRLNDALYLFNVSNSKKSLEDLSVILGRKKAQVSNWRTLNYWSKEYEYGCPHLMTEQLRGGGLPHTGQDHSVPGSIIHQTIEQNVVALIDAHPDVEFHLFTPPFSLLAQALYYQRQPQQFANFIQLREALYSAIPNRKNAALHDFAIDQLITANLSNYKDITHYHPNINRQIVMAIESGSHKVSISNSNQNPWQLSSQAMSYPLENVLENCQ